MKTFKKHLGEKLKDKEFESLYNDEKERLESMMPKQDTGNPLPDHFGLFKNDPTFDDFEKQVAKYRKQLERKLVDQSGPQVSIR